MFKLIEKYEDSVIVEANVILSGNSHLLKFVVVGSGMDIRTIHNLIVDWNERNLASTIGDYVYHPHVSVL